MSEARAETREAVEGVRRGVAERTQVDAALAGVETRLNARVAPIPNNIYWGK